MRIGEGSNYAGGNWRELCAAAAKEADPERLSRLVGQIIEALDEEHEAPRSRTVLLTAQNGDSCDGLPDPDCD